VFFSWTGFSTKHRLALQVPLRARQQSCTTFLRALTSFVCPWAPKAVCAAIGSVLSKREKRMLALIIVDLIFGAAAAAIA